jgi:lysophospholipase L1-like esterase
MQAHPPCRSLTRRGLLLLATGGAFADESKVENASSRHWHQRVAAFAQESPDPGGIVFLGDSMTERFALAALLGHATHKPLINRGIGGDKVGGWRYWGVLDRLDAVLALKPAQVMLMIGVNDLVFAHTPAASLYPNFARLLERLKAGVPKVLVQAVLPVRGGLAQHQASIDAFNQHLTQQVQRLGLDALDQRFAFTGPDGQLRQELAADAVHLNETGYRLWAQALLPWVSAAHALRGDPHAASRSHASARSRLAAAG